MGHAVAPREGYPPRYLVNAFPTKEQFEAMELRGMGELL
jgi:hypothetical protein